MDVLLGSRSARRLMLLITLALASLQAMPAQAADITPAVTATESVAAGTYDQWARVRVDVTWNVPAAQPGDTFTVPLDADLDARHFTSLSLTDGTTVVATAAVVTDAGGAILRDAAGNAQLRFTFTDYVATHHTLSGTAWFELGFDNSRLVFPGSTTTTTVDLYGTPVTVTRSEGPTGDELLKYGYWNSPNGLESEATALNPDGTSANPGADIIWTVQLQGGASSLAPGWTTATIVDTPAPGSHFECPLTPAPAGIVHDPAVPGDVWNATSAVTTTVTACAPQSLTLTVTKAAGDDDIYRIQFPGWIDGAPLPPAFGNDAAITYSSPAGPDVVTNVSTALTRAAQGGSGRGTLATTGGNPTVTPDPGPAPATPSVQAPSAPATAPRLTITNRATASSTTPGGPARWRIVVRNVGTNRAMNVNVCLTPRDQQSFPRRSAAVTLGVTTSVRLNLRRGTGCVVVRELAPGARATVLVDTNVPATARGRVRSTATASANGTATVTAGAALPVRRIRGAASAPAVTG